MTSTKRGDALLAHIAKGGDDAKATAPALLKEVFRGYPVERLRQLLRSDNEAALEAGAWIASELGKAAQPLLDDLVRLLAHPSAVVRFEAFDGVAVAGTTADDGVAIARAVEAIEDVHKSVRRQAMGFLAAATEAQLTTSVPDIRSAAVASLTEWLLACTRHDDADAIVARLEAPERLDRLFAAVAAARIADGDSTALEHAADMSSDDEINVFAMREVDALKRRRLQERRRHR